MIQSHAAEGKLEADYVVLDSWYAQSKLIRQVSEHLPVVCMVKKLPAIRYRHGKRIHDLKSLYRMVPGRRRSKLKGPIIGSITVDMLGGVKVRIVFIRDERNPKKWLALACTDLEISSERICCIYAKRWTIEVFFKQIKITFGSCW